MKHLNELKKILRKIFSNCRKMFGLDKKKGEKMEWLIYAKFSNLSFYIKKCRDMGMKDTSRISQFHQKMLLAFEHLKHIYQYRTPITLRAYSKIFMFVLPICYGPFFAFLSQEYTPQYLVYVVPILFSVILVSLDNIQDHLENPFDQVGEDDVVINAEKFVERLGLAPPGPLPDAARDLQPRDTRSPAWSGVDS